MRILIRTDLGQQYGMGHAIRCRSLAQVLAARGVEVRFVTSTPALREFMTPYPVFLSDPERDWPEFPPGCDSPTEVVVIDTKADDWANEASYLWLLRNNFIKVVRVDCPSATPDTCDLLVGPCQHWPAATVARLRQDFGDRFLYGWDYVMLDEEVTSQPPIPYEQRRDGPMVFCAGGSDPTGALEQMYRWSQTLLPDTEKIFCLPQTAQGGLWGLYDNSQPHSASLDNNIVLAPFSRQYLREAAVVVGLFGVTVYECLWYRTPTLILGRSAGDDENGRLLTIASHTAVRYIGRLGDEHTRTTSPEAFCHNIGYTWDISRQRMHAASAGLLDGRGVARVAEAIIDLS